MRFKKEEYNTVARVKVGAMFKIAKALGEDHAITKLMGSFAWGRHDAEQGPDSNLQTAIREMAFVDGYYKALVRWASINDRKALKIMVEIYPQGMTALYKN